MREPKLPAYLDNRFYEPAPALPSLPGGTAAALLPLVLKVPSQPLKKEIQTYFVDPRTYSVVTVANVFWKSGLDRYGGYVYSTVRHSTRDGDKEMVERV